MELLRFVTPSGNHVLVESGTAPGFSDAAATDRVRETMRAFEAGLEEVAEAADAAVTALAKVAHQPTTIELQFGIRFTAETGLVFTRVATEGTLGVTMTWHRRGTAPDDVEP